MGFLEQYEIIFLQMYLNRESTAWCLDRTPLSPAKPKAASFLPTSPDFRYPVEMHAHMWSQEAETNAKPSNQSQPGS